jgi:hypothetical protein
LGKLSWEAIPFDEPIPLVAAGVVGLVLIGVLARLPQLNLDFHKDQIF